MSGTDIGDSSALTPKALDLDYCNPAQTYLDEYDEVWIGARWDVARRGDLFHVYRKGNWRTVVGSLDLALRIVEDNEGTGTNSNSQAPMRDNTC